MQNRWDYFDQMKGIAILFVVIGHVFLFSFHDTNTAVDSLLTIFHMPVFFYISGFLAYSGAIKITTKKEYGERIWKKTHALLLPYLVFAGIYCFFSGRDYVHLLLGGGAEYWFMYVLLLLSLFFVSIEQVAKRLKHPALYVTAWLVPYALLIYVQRRYGEIGGGVFAINQLVAYYRFYLLGFLCKKYMRLNELVFNNQYVYAIGVVTFFTRWYWGMSCNMIVSFMGITGAIIIMQNYLVSRGQQQSASLKLLSYIGKNSLEIYLIQYFLLPDVSHFVQPYFEVPNGFVWQLLLALVLTIPITAICIFIGNVIKLNKPLRWLMLGK